jgi:hypothetical protein
MTVRELLTLVPLLEEADPDDVVHIDAMSDSILILNQRLGLHQPFEGYGSFELSEADRCMLHGMHVSIGSRSHESL